VSAYDDNDLTALNRLEDLLDAYCDTRLMPRGPVLSRIRATVLAEATAAAATAAAASRLQAFAAPAPKAPRWTLASPFARRFATLGFAATLTLGTTAAVLAAPPGSPFYNARVSLETAFLPTQQDQRSAGHEKLLDERFAEAELAAGRNDMVGLSAALAAYQDEVAAATKDAGSNPAQLAQLENVLAKHSAVLTALAVRLPEQSSIEHAIDASSKAITKLKEKQHPARPAHTPQGGGGQGGNGSNEDRQGQDGGEH
jgi:hypothetical protein